MYITYNIIFSKEIYIFYLLLRIDNNIYMQLIIIFNTQMYHNFIKSSVTAEN